MAETPDDTKQHEHQRHNSQRSMGLEQRKCQHVIERQMIHNQTERDLGQDQGGDQPVQQTGDSRVPCVVRFHGALPSGMIELFEQLLEALLCRTGLRHCLCSLFVLGLIDNNEPNHTEEIMRQAFIAVETWLGECDGHILPHLPGKRCGAVRDHPCDGLSIMTRVTGNEMHRVTGVDMHDCGIEASAPIGA